MKHFRIYFFNGNFKEGHVDLKACVSAEGSRNFFSISHISSYDSPFHRIQDISILFNLIIILLMLFNTFVFQVGLVALLLERFRAMLALSALYLTFSIVLHSWLMVRQEVSRIHHKHTSESFIHPFQKSIFDKKPE